MQNINRKLIKDNLIFKNIVFGMNYQCKTNDIERVVKNFKK